MCADCAGHSSRNYTAMELWAQRRPQPGLRWYDPSYQSPHRTEPRPLPRPARRRLHHRHPRGAVELRNGGDNQRFVLTGGTIRPANAQTLCLAPSGADPTLGAKLVLAACDGSAAQRFVSEPHQAAVFTELKAGNTGKRLDINAGTMANGTNVIAWDCTGNTNQKWYRNPATGQDAQPQGPDVLPRQPGQRGGRCRHWGSGRARTAPARCATTCGSDASNGALVSRVSGLRITAPTSGTGAVTQTAANGSTAQVWNAGASAPLTFSPIPYDAY
ncbi:RICIN domain-containing protein [Yinghuangia aomiensis]